MMDQDQQQPKKSALKEDFAMSIKQEVEVEKLSCMLDTQPLSSFNGTSADSHGDRDDVNIIGETDDPSDISGRSGADFKPAPSGLEDSPQSNSFVMNRTLKQESGIHVKSSDEIRQVSEDTEDTEEDSSSSSSSSSESESETEEDSSSTDSSSEDSSTSESEENTHHQGASDSEDEHRSHLTPPPTTAKEVLVQDLPQVEPVDVILDSNEEIKKVGVVSSIIGQLVVIQSDRDVEALDCDTVLFREDRQAIGVIFEVFGPVPCPLYTVRFNSLSDIKDLKIELKMQVFFAPKIQDITAYVFTQKLKQSKGSDASWEHDEEPPVECLDYSDDEQERAAKNKKKAEKRKRKTPIQRRDNSQDVPMATSENHQTRHQFPSNGHQGYHESIGHQGPRQGWTHGMRPRPPFQSSRGRGMPCPPARYPRFHGPPADQLRRSCHPPAFQQEGPFHDPNLYSEVAGNPHAHSPYYDGSTDWYCDGQRNWQLMPPPMHLSHSFPPPPPPPPPAPPPNGMPPPHPPFRMSGHPSNTYSF